MKLSYADAGSSFSVADDPGEQIGEAGQRVVAHGEHGAYLRSRSASRLGPETLRGVREHELVRLLDARAPILQFSFHVSDFCVYRKGATTQRAFSQDPLRRRVSAVRYGSLRLLRAEPSTTQRCGS